jgi:predicted transposase YbfD/YdcC
VPAVSSSRICAAVSEIAAAVAAPGSFTVSVTGRDRVLLVEALAQTPDPRARRGVRYPFAVLLAVAVCAVMAGARSFAAVADWAVDLPAQQRSQLGLTGAVPDPVTFWRVLTRVDAAGLQQALGAWLRAVRAPTTPVVPGRCRPRLVLAVDGKALRATRNARGRGNRPVHLLAAVEHGRGVVVAQVDVDAKTNEVALFSDLLDQVEDLTDVLVTVDALHAQTSHAEFLHARGAHLLVTVKGNQPTLHATLKALPWKDVPVGHVNTSHGHGRIENRTVKAVTVAAGLGFPHAAQAIKITRVSTPINRKGGRRREVVYAICTLPAEQAQPADLATWIRGHWHIENKLHWVRDVTFGEDLHQARTGSGPEVMAILRNLAISLHRLAGATNIARALRRHGRHPNEAIMTLTRDYRTTQ